MNTDLRKLVYIQLGRIQHLSRLHFRGPSFCLRIVYNGEGDIFARFMGEFSSSSTLCGTYFTSGAIFHKWINIFMKTYSGGGGDLFSSNFDSPGTIFFTEIKFP